VDRPKSNKACRQRQVDLGHIDLHVREEGDGPLMLFLHGLTSNSAVFEHLMPNFSDRFHCMAVDQRGHGLSGKPAAGYAARDYAGDIAALILKLDRGPAIVVGHSLGARNAVTAAASFPDLVRAAIAIDFTPYIEDEVFDALEERVNIGNQLFPDEQAILSYLHRRYPRLPAAAVEARAASGYHRVEGGFRPWADPAAMSQTANGLRSDLRPIFEAVAKPVLMMRGQLSALVSSAALEKTRRLRPDIPAVVVPDVDHYVNEEAPALTSKAIADFIDAF
jgi:2-(acetamidomethylene)succinate hydrolase